MHLVNCIISARFRFVSFNQGPNWTEGDIRNSQCLRLHVARHVLRSSLQNGFVGLEDSNLISLALSRSYRQRREALPSQE